MKHSELAVGDRLFWKGGIRVVEVVDLTLRESRVTVRDASGERHQVATVSLFPLNEGHARLDRSQKRVGPKIKEIRKLYGIDLVWSGSTVTLDADDLVFLLDKAAKQAV